MFAKNSQFGYFGRVLTSPYSFHQHPPNFNPASPLCLGTFHPASTRYSTHIKLGHSSTSKAVVPHQTYSCMFLNIYIYKKHLSSFHQSLTAGINSSLRACGHDGCWVEFHPHHCLRGDNDEVMGSCPNEISWHLIFLNANKIRYPPPPPPPPKKKKKKKSQRHPSPPTKVASVPPDHGLSVTNGLT